MVEARGDAWQQRRDEGPVREAELEGVKRRRAEQLAVARER